jgi:hypothetical protein
VTDTLLDKADALMRRRGFNANLKPAETSDALPEIQELSGDDTPSAPLAMELNEDEDKETALQSAPALSTAEECLEPAQSTDSTDPATANPDIPPLAPDIPTLTDIVQTGTPAPSTPFTETEQATLESHQALDRWLEEALPQAVAAALDNLKDRLIHELRERARVEVLPETLRHPPTMPPPA